MKAHIGLTANKYSKQNYKYLRRPGKHSSLWLSQVWEKTLINVLNFISSVIEISFPGFLVIEIIHSHTDCLQPSCIPNVITNGRETGVFLFLCFCIKNMCCAFLSLYFARIHGQGLCKELISKIRAKRSSKWLRQARGLER